MNYKKLRTHQRDEKRAHLSEYTGADYTPVTFSLKTKGHPLYDAHMGERLELDQKTSKVHFDVHFLGYNHCIPRYIVKMVDGTSYTITDQSVYTRERETGRECLWGNWGVVYFTKLK